MQEQVLSTQLVKNSVEKMKHSLIELHILKKQHAEETFTYHFLVSFCVPPV